MILHTLLAILIIPILMLPYLGWFWFLGSSLNRKVQENIRRKTSFFKIAILYSLFFMPAVLALNAINNDNVFGEVPQYPYLVFMFLLAYICYFVSRNLSMASSKEPVYLLDYIVNIALFWVFPFGIFWNQPQINKLFRENKENSQQTHDTDA